MNPNPLVAIDQEIARLENDLTRLRQARAILAKTEVYPAQTAKPSPPPQKAKAPAKKKGKRAPYGEFKKTLLSFFSNGTPLSNADVREKLSQSSYNGSHDPLHVRTSLKKLAKKGELLAVKDGGNVRYTLPKKSHDSENT